MSVLLYFFINRILFIYIPAIFEILGILFFKFKMKLIKPSRIHAWSTVEKMLISPLPQFSLKTLKKHQTFQMIYLNGIHFLVLSTVVFANISSTCNSPRINLSVIIFLIRLLPSNSAKISFSNTLLISEKIFRNVVFHKYLETLEVFSLCLLVATRPALLEKIFQQEFSRNHKSVGQD